MIIKEIITINNKQFIKHYSDLGVYIQKVNTEELYSAALDSIDSGRVYEETDELIEVEEEKNTNEATIEDYQDALGEFGVEV